MPDVTVLFCGKLLGSWPAARVGITGAEVLVGDADSELDVVVVLEIGAEDEAALDGVAVTVTVTTEIGGGVVVTVVSAAATRKYLEWKTWE